MRQRLVLCLVLAAAPALAAAQDGAADAPGYELETLATGLDMPWCVAFLPEGGFLVTELGGTLRRVGVDGVVGDPVAGVPAVYRASQGGLFDVLLAPDFSASRVLYLTYAEGPPDSNTTAVARARLAGDALADVEVIFRVTPRKDTPVHYGGRLAWHPDGTLLLTTGDGFDYREAAQDLGSQMGKVIRMHPDGTPAEGNPFPEAPYVWSYGHRNPQGLSVAADGTVWLHEHGPKGGDEVNVIEPGVNYGWPVITYGLDYNGAYVSPFTEMQGMRQPLHVWTPSIAPSGLTVYEGALFPEWRGDLFAGALVDKDVRRLDVEGGEIVGEEVLFGEIGERIRDVATGPDGAIYILAEGEPGTLWRVTR
jgi:glucose/arabinose dehydrogenase